MSSVFKLSKPSPDLRKNSFDLSEKSLYSMSAGMLLPVMCKELNPGEKVQCSLNSFARTQPLNTAAFVRNRMYYHYFFVPNKQLWSGWDNFINGVDYRTSALQVKQFGSSGKYTKIPSMNFMKCLSHLIKSNLFIDNVGTKLSANAQNATKDEHGYYYYRGISRILDMLGYGFNFQGFSSHSTDTTTQGLNTNVLCRSLSELVDNVFRAHTEHQLNQTNIYKLLAELEKVSFHVNPLRLLAYQKIYSDFYKNDDYEGTTPEVFNIDDFDGSKSIDNATIDANRLLGMCRLRYRWSPKDYFTNVVPSELAGTISLSRNDMYDYESDVDRDLHWKLSNSNNSVVLDSANSPLSTRSIRSAFALEKMLRVTRRAGGFDYDSQIKAHYGWEVPKGRSTDVQYIGGFTGNLDINEVITQATTPQATTGQIMGKGVGSVDGKPINFTAPEHGILMCIASVVPELDYSCEGLDRFNTKFFRGDYYQPEFQDLGHQPLFGYELLNTRYTSSQQANNRIDSNAVLGFVPRYSEYKTSYDKLHGQFRNGQNMAAWSAGSLLNYVGGVVISTLKINPKCLDRIFSRAFDGSETYDQFLVQTQFVTKVIRPISVSGQNL